MFQGTNEWFDARLGRFTASGIHKLMGVKGLGATGETYAFEKAVEIVFGRDEENDFDSFDIRRGKELESVAFAKFKELKELDFIEVQNCTFFPFGPDAGASPDGLVGSDAVLETKCPRPNKFFNLLKKGVPAIDAEYIDQMQMQMLCTKTERAHFFNFIIWKGKSMCHELIIERDETRIELIKERIKEAIVIRDKDVDALRKNLQCG